MLDACPGTVVVVVLDEATSLVPRKAHGPCVAVGFQLLRRGWLAIGQMKPSDLTVAFHFELPVAREHGCIDAGPFCSLVWVVAVLVRDLDVTKAAGKAVHGHETLSGAGEWQVLVRVYIVYLYIVVYTYILQCMP